VIAGEITRRNEGRRDRISRTGDPNIEMFADAVVLFKAGDVPADVFGRLCF
jgi:hypothetical protein